MGIFIETKRLRLDYVQMGKVSEYFDNVTSWEESFKYFNKHAHENVVQTVSLFQDWIGKYSEHPFRWLIYLKQCNQVIGQINIHNYKIGYKNAEIGYAIGPAFQGSGYASEACQAVINYMFENAGVHTLQAVAHVDNHASQAVMKKCGMRFEAVLHEREFIEDAYSDSVLYYITEDMWKESRVKV